MNHLAKLATYSPERLVSFGVKRDMRVRRLVQTAPVLADFPRFEPTLPRNYSLIELIVDCALSGISCM